jgi:thymidylate kinase
LPSLGETQHDKHQDNKLQTLLYPEQLDKVVRRIQSEARTAVEESGINMLFLCLGFLKWSDADTSDIFYHAPLIMLPIAIERDKVDAKTGYAKFVIKYTGEDILDNICLREKLRQFAIELPSFDDFENPEAYFIAIEDLIREIKPKWAIDRFATTGFLSFGKMLMYLDLDPARWPITGGVADAPHIVDIFNGSYANYGTMAEEFDIDGDEKLPRLPLVMDADSSQHSAIIDVLAGKNIVIEGPPGTGKSQTITNLIAACLAHGKTVLFVAEKLTALEVVRRRLDNIGLGTFCLELHSHKTQKKALLADIKKRLDINTTAYRNALNDVEARVQELNQKKAKLIAYTNAINTPFGGVEETPHQIFWKTDCLRRDLAETISPESFPAVPSAASLSQSDIKRKTEAVKDLADSLREYFAGEYQAKTHFWHGFTTLTAVDYALKQESVSALRQLRAASQDAFKALENLESIGLRNDLFSEYMRFVEKIDQFSEEEFKYAAYYDNFSIEVLQSQLEQARDIIARYAVSHSAYKALIARSGLQESQLEQLDAEGISNDLTHYAQLNLNEAGKRSQHLQQAIEDWNAAYAVFREAVQNLGLTQDTDTLFGYRAVCAAAHLAATVEGHTLSLRHPMIEDALDSPLLAKVFEIVPALQQHKAAVGEHFSLEHLPPLTSLQEIREALHQGGAFRSLSRRWRKARRQYAQVAKTSADASQQTTIERLDALIAYLKATDAFRLDDAALHALLPGVFAGVETDIEALHKIIRFYRAIQERILPLPTYGLMLAQQLKRMDKSFYDWLRQQEPVIRKGLDALHVLVQATRAEEKAATPLPQVLANAEQEIISLKRLETTLVAVGVSRSVEFSLLSETLAAKNEFIAARTAFHMAPAIRQISLSDAAEECPQHLERIAQLLSTARKAFQILPHAILPKVLHVNGHAFLTDIKASISGLATYQQQLDRFGQVLGKDAAKLEFWGTTAGSEKQLLERINAKLQHLEENESSFQQWCDVLNAFDAVRQQNLAVLILSFASSAPEVAFSHYVPLFQYLLYWNLSQKALQQNSVLGSFSRISHENIRKSFKEIDVELQKLNAKKLAWDISRKNIPEGKDSGKSPKDFKDMRLIQHELSRQRGHVPIRKLVGNAYDALVALKPCFMMGPLSVAQYLAPGNKKFDIVVMDEASQIKPEDALGVLARAKQVVVVGDSNQLPPTSFFDKLGTDAEDEEEVTAIQDSESILDVYKPVFQPNRRLRWHYRSQHQSLISSGLTQQPPLSAAR